MSRMDNSNPARRPRINPPAAQEGSYLQTNVSNQTLGEDFLSGEKIYPESDLVDLVLRGTSFPLNTETVFLDQTMQSVSDRVRFEDSTIAGISTVVERVVSAMNPAEQTTLLTEMINLGNFYDIHAFAHLYLQENGSFKSQLGSIVEKVLSQKFDYKMLYQRYMLSCGAIDAGDLNSEKQQMNLPKGVSMDVLSYKIPMTAAEYLLQLTGDPNMLSPDNFTFFNTIATQCEGVMRAKIAGLVQLDQSDTKMAQIVDQDSVGDAAASPNVGLVQSDKIDTYTVLLEGEFAARDGDFAQVDTHLLGFGDKALALYVVEMIPMFVRGIIPGALQPSSIAASHDILSMQELTAAIYELAESYILQKGDSAYLGFARGATSNSSGGAISSLQAQVLQEW